MSTITNVGSYTTDMASGISSGQRHAHGGHKPDPTQFASNLFKLLDTNNTGSIDKTQLESAFSQTSSNSTSATDTNSKADALFASLDTNGDGQLTQAEVASALQQKMSAASDQFATRMGMQGKGHHKPDGDSDDANNAATSASNTATPANNSLQRQLMEMMRMMGISGSGTAQTAALSATVSATA